jgi:hypothetical protein
LWTSCGGMSGLVAGGEGNLARHAKVKARWLARIWNLAAFVQSVKQRFSVWFNKVQEEEQARLPSMEMLGKRVRYFTDGLVVGNKDMLEEVFDKARTHFGPKRKTGARKMRGDDWGGLKAMRDLRSEAAGKTDN